MKKNEDVKHFIKAASVWRMYSVDGRHAVTCIWDTATKWVKVEHPGGSSSKCEPTLAKAVAFARAAAAKHFASVSAHDDLDEIERRLKNVQRTLGALR